MKYLICLLLLLPLSGCFSYTGENEYERASKKYDQKITNKMRGKDMMNSGDKHKRDF